MITLKTVFLSIAFAFLFVSSHAQSRQKLFAKVDSLKAVLLRADTLSPFDASVENINDTIYATHDKISKLLCEILTDKTILYVNADSLLKLPSLGKVHSSDKRLWIFNWYENTGGSWKSNLSLVHYRTQRKELRANCEASSDEMQTETTAGNIGFCSNGAWFEKIYKLKSPGKDLYLCIGSGISCNTCIYNIATVVELTKDSINFGYHAFRFQSDEYNSPADANQACFTLDARMGDIEKFEFDPGTQTLLLVYLTDDNTPVRSDKPKRIVRRMVFDGTKFTGNGYK